MAETTAGVDLVIYRKLAGSGPCTFEELVHESVFGAGSAQPGGNHLGQPYARPRLRDIRSGGLLPFPGLRKTESVKRHYLR
jgi:hypothetical protein